MQIHKFFNLIVEHCAAAADFTLWIALVISVFNKQMLSAFRNIV